MQSKTLKGLSPSRHKTTYIRKKPNLINSVNYKESSIIHTKRKVKLWKKSEEDLLTELHEVYGNNWIQIAQKMEGRNPSQCIQRWRRKFQPLKVRKNWTSEEDRRLLKVVNEHGNNWKKLSNLFNKSPKQIRERYLNKLDPTINKGLFTKEEDEIILQNYMKFGTKWNVIAKKLSGRPQNSIKNRFYSHLKKKLQKYGYLDNFIQEEEKTENIEENEIENINENKNGLNFLDFLNGDFKTDMFQNEENDDRNKEMNIKEREVDNKNMSDYNFLNKYIDIE